MGVGKVDQEDLGQLPVLFIVDVVDEIDLKFLDLAHALGQLEDDQETQVDHGFEVGTDVNEHDESAEQVDEEVLVEVVLCYLSEVGDLLASHEAHRGGVDQQLRPIEYETEYLK